MNQKTPSDPLLRICVPTHEVPTCPLVTVIALCYNHSRFVVECLNGIAAQTYGNIQVIIVDDCSTDDSVEVIERWRVERGVTGDFIVHETNQGICRSLNDALALAKGEYIALVATDDVWLPSKIEHQVALMEAAPADVGVVHGNAWRMDEHGALGKEVMSERMHDLGWSEVPQGNIYHSLWKGNFIAALTPLARTSCYREVGKYDESLSYEDYDMWLRIARKFRFIYDPEVVACYRIVATSLTRTGRDRLDQSKELIFEKHLTDPTLSPQDRAWVRREYVSFKAIQAYRNGGRGARRSILEAARESGEPRFIMMLACSILRVPFQKYSNLMCRFKALS